MEYQQFWTEEEFGERLETRLAKLRTLHLRIKQAQRDQLTKTTDSAVTLFRRALRTAAVTR
jgi:hypothetical protein